VTRLRAVVFDLDGTLAATDHLDFGDRTAATVLTQTAPGRGRHPWATPGSQLPAQLLRLGYRVAVVSRSPPSYAWTLAWALQLDYEELCAGSQPYGSDPAGKLRHLANLWGMIPAEVLYVGDSDADASAARSVGCGFRYPWWGRHGRERVAFPRVRAPLPLENLISRIPREGTEDPGLNSVDEAVDRLIAGDAGPDDYAMLLERGYLSQLLEFGDVDLLPSSLRAVRRRPGPPPWADCDSVGVWEELLATGDVGRLLDMDPVRLLFRLPDPDLDRVVHHEAAAGAHRTVERTMTGLDPLVARKIALTSPPRHPWPRLKSEIDAWSGDHPATTELSTSSLLEDEMRAVTALQVLANDPGSPARGELQLIAMAHLPARAGACLMRTPTDTDYRPRRPGLPAWLLTRAEYDANNRLREAVLDRHREWFAARDVVTPGARACVPYRYHEWGEYLWRYLKDWRGNHSGHRVHLDLLEPIALALAGHLVDRGAEAVVPVPSSPFSPAQPGQLSERIAHRAARLAGTPLIRALSKSVDGGVKARTPAGALHGRRVVLLEDQITTGSTVMQCLATLTRHTSMPVEALSWSSSQIGGAWPLPHQITGCWLDDHGLLGQHPRLKCALSDS
jgi:hypothetical protein